MRAPELIDRVITVSPISEQRKAAESDEFACLPALENLLMDLLAQDIRYVHWKSNLRLDKSLQGRTDLDLLVANEHKQLFLNILAERSIKQVNSAPGKEYPGISNYLGFDPASGRMFHLHVHDQLVLGEQFVKNYHLPVENLFFENVIVRKGVKIPLPEVEICILALRALLKYRDRDAFKDILKIRSAGLPRDILNEIRWLYDQTSMDRIDQILAQAGDDLPVGVIREFLGTVLHNSRAGWKFIQLRREVRRAMRSYQYNSRWLAIRRYFQETWRRRTAFRLEPPRKMTLAAGGMTIALVGADGSGKSTLTKELKSWLGWKLDVVVYYLGSKQPSRTSRWLYQLFRLARRNQRSLVSLFGEGSLPAQWSQGIAQAMLNSHHLSNARDRLRRYRKGIRRKQSGSIVIFDRFPLSPILDGAKIQDSTNESFGTISSYLANKEQAIYAQFQPPDTFYVLEVSPKASIHRKPDHSADVIVQKCAAIHDLANSADKSIDGPRVIPINADLPLLDVTRQIKNEIWKSI